MPISPHQILHGIKGRRIILIRNVAYTRLHKMGPISIVLVQLLAPGVNCVIVSPYLTVCAAKDGVFEARVVVHAEGVNDAGPVVGVGFVFAHAADPFSAIAYSAYSFYVVRTVEGRIYEFVKIEWSKIVLWETREV